ncbi:interleukin 13 receptor, alpha 1 precursor [Silurus asotus]|uniref:Interleukin 13 receptor, alpha 1 n=1 Tax=Silurus asotus TaxID=30991 RepID=A0AAD5A4E3_SILAS|nr:interleukin 13 receptor, alpha 1 precursor [Silurus asotus]
MVLPGWGGSVLLMCMSFALDGLASVSGDLPPPENLSLSWDLSVLSLRVHWREPVGLGTDCKVNYTLAIYNEQKCPPSSDTPNKHRTDRLNFESSISKEDEICVGITTNPMDCENKKASKEVYKHLSPPRGEDGDPNLPFKVAMIITPVMSLGGGKLYVPVKEIVASGVNVDPKSALLHPNHESCI